MGWGQLYNDLLPLSYPLKSLDIHRECGLIFAPIVLSLKIPEYILEGVGGGYNYIIIAPIVLSLKIPEYKQGVWARRGGLVQLYNDPHPIVS